MSSGRGEGGEAAEGTTQFRDKPRASGNSGVTTPGSHGHPAASKDSRCTHLQGPHMRPRKPSPRKPHAQPGPWLWPPKLQRHPPAQRGQAKPKIINFKSRYLQAARRKKTPTVKPCSRKGPETPELRKHVDRQPLGAAVRIGMSKLLP